MSKKKIKINMIKYDFVFSIWNSDTAKRIDCSPFNLQKRGTKSITIVANMFVHFKNAALILRINIDCSSLLFYNEHATLLVPVRKIILRWPMILVRWYFVVSDLKLWKKEPWSMSNWQTHRSATQYSESKVYTSKNYYNS